MRCPIFLAFVSAVSAQEPEINPTAEGISVPDCLLRDLRLSRCVPVPCRSTGELDFPAVGSALNRSGASSYSQTRCARRSDPGAGVLAAPGVGPVGLAGWIAVLRISVVNRGSARRSDVLDMRQDSIHVLLLSGEHEPFAACGIVLVWLYNLQLPSGGCGELDGNALELCGACAYRMRAVTRSFVAAPGSILNSSLRC